MFGTLIGVFITTAGIVIGVDSVHWGASPPGPTRVEKTCQPSSRSVAALEGWYGEDLALHRRFRDSCLTLRRSPKPLSIEEQADRLIEKLQRAYRDQVGSLPARAASVPPPGSKHVASVVVAGFEGSTPLATVRELRWDRARKGGWRLIAERTGKLSFQGCGAKFIGEDRVASLLLDTSLDFAEEKRRPDVRAASRANRLRLEDNCFVSAFTIDEAKQLYRTAVRLTIDYSDEYLIQAGSVGGRLHILTIPPTGPIEEEAVDPEEYVGDRSLDESRFTDFSASPGRGQEETS
jgi:hypothetical protein